MLFNLVDDCVSVINDQKRSLGIVKPGQVVRYWLADNPRYGEMFQMGLPLFTEHDQVQVKRDFPSEPRVQYRCQECTAQQPHNQQILEWGFYEWLRKFPEKAEQVWDNAGFTKPEFDLYFLVGNQFAYRNSFMVISVLRFLKAKGPETKSMFPYKKYDEERLQRLLDSIDNE